MERKPQTAPTERELVALARTRLGSLLPKRWSLEDAAAGPREDAALTISAPDGKSARLVVEAKSQIDAKSVPLLVDRLAPVRPAIVAAGYLSPRAREALAEADISFVDATGNLLVLLEEPGLSVRANGEDRDPYRMPDRPTTGMRGGPAARVARALADRRPPWRMRDLAEVAGTSLGSAARTVDFLDREALLKRDDTIIDVDWAGVLRRWADDYELGRKRRVVPALVGRGVESIEPALRASDLTYAVSGSLAAQLFVQEADARLGLVYAEDVEALLATVAGRETDGPSNLLVIQPTDDTPYLRAQEQRGVRYAALSQVVADLLVGSGRMPQEGEALLRWMADNEGEWRT